MIECWKRGLYWQGLVHDLSKFLPSEWFAYANYFYNDDADPDEAKKTFQTAMVRHFNRNPHHWGHWYFRFPDGKEILLEMPDKYVMEMICDWVGVSKVKGTDVIKWYEANKDRMKLHDKTRASVRHILHHLY
jgi:hypothetical protein